MKTHTHRYTTLGSHDRNRGMWTCLWLLGRALTQKTQKPRLPGSPVLSNPSLWSRTYQPHLCSLCIFHFPTHDSLQSNSILHWKPTSFPRTISHTVKMARLLPQSSSFRFQHHMGLGSFSEVCSALYSWKYSSLLTSSLAHTPAVALTPAIAPTHLLHCLPNNSACVNGSFQKAAHRLINFFLSHSLFLPCFKDV